MGIWDIFPALPPSLCLFLPLCLSVSLSPSSSFYLFFSPTPSYPFSHFLYHPSFVSQYFPCYKPLYLLLTTDFLSCLLSSIYVSCSFSFCIRRIMLCMFHVTMPTLHPRRPFKKPFEPLLSFISYPALSFLLHLSLNKVYSGVLPVTNTSNTHTLFLSLSLSPSLTHTQMHTANSMLCTIAPGLKAVFL